MKPDTATQHQIDAADPTVSTWLSANAGSGKTRVLTDRVARLLLNGASPQKILCLTYTKAAASEMQNRLFKRLGEWSMKNDADLAAALRELGVEKTLKSTDLAHARTLFAQALETPGGLKIQTIHSFCGSLLRRFPLEAGVSPFFREIEDRAAKLLRQDVLEEMSQGEDANLVRALAQHVSGEKLATLTANIVRNRLYFGENRLKIDIWDQLSLPPNADRQSIIDAVFLGGEAAMLDALRPALTDGKPADLKTLTALESGLALGPDFGAIGQLSDYFLFGAKTKAPFAAKVGTVPTKDVQKNHPAATEELHDFMQRIEAARQPRLRLLSAERTLIMHQFAHAFLKRYGANKDNRGWLDFDDLIQLAQKLLTDPLVAQWVLFRLDGGIDHILVDEAQDTSPLQWQVIQLLAQEFTAGLGARADVNRTIFVVGDLKQSIYSFQGADPSAFGDMRQHFASGLADLDQPLHERSLDYSFRSSAAILNLVDHTFECAGFKGLGGTSHHIAYHQNLPGRVDLWPVIERPEKPPEREWYDPTDQISANDEKILLARQIAEQIDHLIRTETIAGKNGAFRPVTAGDFLILVQRRSDLFHEIIRACKARDLPVAGADRLKIGAELAVRDISALLAFLSLPDDSLALASALRSPLIGITEAQLYDLAHNRHEAMLWAALERRREEFADAFEMLRDLRARADYQSPYDLIERILTNFGGRQNLLARLGPEAEDGIDALISQALAYERSETPSLTGFLVWLETDDMEIKRQAESSGDRIRVMTTHGAKGLESPIVILPDTGVRRASPADDIVQLESGTTIWSATATQRPDAEAEVHAELSARQEEERLRLLYVAMTRAEKWLIVCAAGKTGDESDSWYSLIDAGMQAAGAVPCDQPFGQSARLETGDWPNAGLNAPTSPSTKHNELPEWATKRAAAPVKAPAVLNPSNLAGAKALPGEAETQQGHRGKEWGTGLHLLLEHLPIHDRTKWSLIANNVAAETKTDASELLAEAATILDSPDIAHLFANGSLAEVDITAPIPELGGQRMRGSIDRLIIGETRILCVDYKTNAVVPNTPQDIPVGILAQLRGYQSQLEQIYPDHRIDMAILWTKVPLLMNVPHDIVRNAVLTPQHLDDPATQT